MHRKRVTYELHDSYFRLMTIKHAIPKIEWVIELALNYYITQSRQKTESWSYSWRRSYRREVVGKATSGPKGPWWVRVQRRCWQNVVEEASTQQKADPRGLQLSSPGERERHNTDIIRERHNTENEKDIILTAIILTPILSGGQNVAVMFGLQLPLTRKCYK